MTGFRVAKGGAQDYFGVTPDLTTMGKVIGGGMPVGAYGGRKDIMLTVAPAGPMYQASKAGFNVQAYMWRLCHGATWVLMKHRRSPWLRSSLRHPRVAMPAPTAPSPRNQTDAAAVPVQAGTLSGNPLAMVAGIKTLEILARPGAYEYLDKMTGKLINGIVKAGKDAGHAITGGHINGMFGFFFMVRSTASSGAGESGR